MFADDLDDPGADLIVAALIINARLRGPGLRDLLGSLSASVREELDMRRKVSAERRSTRRSVQIVVRRVGRAWRSRWPCSTTASWPPTTGRSASCVLVVGGRDLRRWASSGCGGWRTFEAPQRLLSAWVPEGQAGPAAPAASASASAAVPGSAP